MSSGSESNPGFAAPRIPDADAINREIDCWNVSENGVILEFVDTVRVIVIVSMM